MQITAVSIGTRLAGAVGLVLLAAGCGGHRDPEISRIASTYSYRDARQAFEPVVLVPGFLGSNLVDKKSGDEIWGLFLSGEERSWNPGVQQRVALPMTGGDTLRQMRDSVVVAGPMEDSEIDLAGHRITVNAYPGLLWGILRGLSGEDSGSHAPSERELRKSTREAVSDPVPQIHSAAYDWRRDIAEAAHFLDEAVRAAHRQKLEQGLSGEAARVDVLAHSMGTLVARYYLRFGTQPLPEDGSLPVLDWRGAERVRRVLLVAPPNNGSLEAFRDLALGGSPEPPIPKYPAAVLGTFVSLYQMMPGTREAAVVYSDDGSAVDVLDVEAWERLGWGPFRPDQDSVLVNLLPEAGSAAERRSIARRYLTLSLARARQLGEALGIDSQPPAGTTIHLFVGDTIETHARVEVDRVSGELVRHHRQLGDGTVTRRSALGRMPAAGGVSEPRVRSPLHPISVHFVQGDHLSMVGSPDFLDNALHLLLEAPR